MLTVDWSSYENSSLSSVQPLSRVQLFVTPWTQHTRTPCPSPTPRVYSDSCPLSWWCHPTISSSVIPFSSCLQSSQHQGLFQWVSSSHQVAKVLELRWIWVWTSFRSWWWTGNFNLTAAVTVCSGFGAQENQVCYCFHCFPIYLPLSDWTRCHDLGFLNVEFLANFIPLFKKV